MEAIEQLKTMRDQARARIEALPDYKLMTKLTTLIEEMEGTLAGSPETSAAAGSESAEEEEASEDESPISDAHSQPDELDADIGESSEETAEAQSEPEEDRHEPVEAEAVASEEETPQSAVEEAPYFETTPIEPAPIDTTPIEPEPFEPESVEPTAYEPVELDSSATSVLEELEKLTIGVKDGDAQHEVEQTPAVDPLDEITEAAISMIESGNGLADDDGLDEIELDTDSAIMQAMAELEADLGNADLDIEDDPDDRR